MEIEISPSWWQQGQKLDVLTYPNPILKKVAEPVTRFDEKLEQLCKNMLYTMYSVPGIGLAAPQVGVSQRIFVMDVDHEKERVENTSTESRPHEAYQYSHLNAHIFINPVIVNKQGSTTYREGCLSVPGIYEDVNRSESITVHYQCLKGQRHTLNAEGLLAICTQHENDHLDGIVFLERLSLLKRNLLTKKFLKKKEAFKLKTSEAPKNETPQSNLLRNP